MFQRWHDLLFAHWPLDPEHVRAALPSLLRPYLQLHDGAAWVGVIPFWMSNIHVRGLPPIPGFSTYPELNVRTYVEVNGIPGVYFFSLDITGLSPVYAARMVYGLEYFYARMKAEIRDQRTIDYSCLRRLRTKPAEFRGSYGPAGEVLAEPGPLADFVTNRYCLYAVRNGKLVRGHIHHLPWPLQPATCQIKTNTMAASHGIALPSPAQPPVFHYAQQMDVLIWAPEPVT